jgi:serine/threonine protein kinase
VSSASHRCPRCKAVHPGPVALGSEILCDTCGHRWVPGQGSDEYLPVEGGGGGAPAALTERRTPPRTAVSPSSGLPFDRLEAESARSGKSPRPVSELAFSPSTDSLNGDRSNCPVCGHSFVGKPGSDEQHCPACGTAFVRSTGRLTPGAVSGGDRLIGRILRGCQIDRKLGEGGMGAVYHARQLSLDRSVAIKVLPPELARNRNFIQRFEREAKSLARINHANILQIYDFGEDTQLGVYFMVIEFVDGWDLGEVLRRQPTLSQIETLDIVRQALLGLEQAAEKGVIHRDIKPDNLMVATSGLCKVSDFGLAKGSAGDSEVTSVGVRVGTPAFMSPEQCDGVEVDTRSDVYNLGCTAFLMLTGHLPFDGETPFSIMLKHKVDPVPSMRTYRQDIDPEVDSLIRRMMQKKPDDRCFELRELIDDAEKLLVRLTGTASVLRKTNGPIRALVEHATGKVSSGKRGSVVSSIEDSGIVRPPAPIPGAKPSGRHRTADDESSRRKPPTVIPDWLKPVDASAVPSATPKHDGAVKPSPPVGSRTGPAPAIGSRSAPSPAVGSRTGPAPAIGSRSGPAPVSRLSGMVPTVPPPTLATPFPGMVTPLPGERKAGTTSSTLTGGGMDRVRERGIRAEVASIAAGAERLAAAGSWDQAASEWKRAAHLAHDTSESRRLTDLAADAATHARRRRRIRGLVITGASLALLAVNLWIWPPVVHNLLGERERARLDAIAEPAERSRRLREFAALNQGGWRWYRALFQTGYEVRAAATAAASAEQRMPVVPPRPTSQQRTQPAPISAAQAKALAELNSLAQDAEVPMQRVVEAARPLAGDAQAAAILAEAQRRIGAAAEFRGRIDAARAQGRHGEALDLVQRAQAEHPRAGDVLADLPMPGRVRVVDADSGAAVPGLHLLADGGELVGAEDGRFCRSRNAAVQLEVQAPGYVSRRLTIPAGGDAAELVVDVNLSPGPVWRVAAPNERPTWIRLHAAGSAAVLLTPSAASVIDPANGVVRALTLPGTKLVSWWQPVDGAWAFATSDGEQRQLLPTLDRAVPVRRLGGAPLALLEIELVYRSGGRLAVSVEDAPGDRILVARDGVREVWRLAGLAGACDPQLRRADDKLVVIDDLTVRVVEEDGTESARLPLAAARTGPWAELPGNRIVIATSTGVQMVQYGKGGAKLVPHPWLNEAGPAVPASLGDTMLLARQRDQVADLATWEGDRIRPRWRGKLSGRPVQASLSLDYAAIVDEAGTVVVLRMSDGSLARRIVHGAPPAAAPLLLPGVLVVVDQTGAVAGYRLPPTP